MGSEALTAVIEIPLNYHTKYEIKDGTLWVDRILNHEYPCNYGYIPNTLWDDGDALDICIVGHISLHPMAHIKVVPKAVLKVVDNGVSDWKLIAGVTDCTRVADHLESLTNFFNSYKPGVVVEGAVTEGADLEQVVSRARSLFRESGLIRRND